MRSRLLAVVLVAACGGPTGGAGAADDDAGGGIDAVGAQDGDVGGPDGGDGGGGGGDAGDGGGGGGGGGGAGLACTAPVVPSQTTTLTGQYNMNDVEVFSAGGRVFARHSKLPLTLWWRWTGTGWNEETIPWHAAIPTGAYIRSVHRALDGGVVIVTQGHLVTFDGMTMRDPVALPAVSDVHSYARGTDGRYHVFHAKHESVSKSDGTWDPPAPIPIPTIDSTPSSSATVMADGRVVVVYHDVFFDDDDLVHLYAISRAPGQTWGAPQDLTPNWAVRANRPIVYAPPNGGLVVAANGNGVGAVVWRSTDGVAFGTYHQLGLIFPHAIDGPCLDALAITAGYQTRYDVFGYGNGAWSTLRSRSLSYIVDADVAMTPDGNVIWGLGETNQVEYMTPP